MKIRTLVTTITTSLMLATSIGVSAHNNIGNDCNIELNGNLKYENEVLTVLLSNGSEAEFRSSGLVYIDGNALPLSHEEAIQAQNYYQSIHDSIPTTVEIAKEAVSIANTTIVEVFGELLGHDDELTQEFGHFFDEVNYEIDNKFYTDDGAFFMDTTSFEQGQWVDQGWEQEFEEKVESLMSKSIGRLLIAVGTEMLWGDGDSDAFEARMENFGEDLEHRLSSSTELLEVKAEELCEILERADTAENHLSNTVTELSDLDLLSVDAKGQRM